MRVASRISEYLKVRGGAHVFSKVLMVAYAVHETGRREVVGIQMAESETEARCAEFLRDLKARGLTGVKLSISDDHLGLKSAIQRAIDAPWQRCTVHFIRNMHGHCRKGIQRRASRRCQGTSRIRDRTTRANRAESSRTLGRCRGRSARVLPVPQAHWKKLRSTNNIERVNKEIARRSDGSGSAPTTKP